MHQEFNHAFFIKHTIADHLVTLDGRSFLPEFGGLGGHGPREDTTNIRVVAARCHIEHNLAATRTVKHRCNDLLRRLAWL